MKTFAHVNARSVDEAIQLLVKYKGKAKLNAGAPAPHSTFLGQHSKLPIPMSIPSYSYK